MSLDERASPKGHSARVLSALGQGKAAPYGHNQRVMSFICGPSALPILLALFQQALDGDKQ